MDFNSHIALLSLLEQVYMIIGLQVHHSLFPVLCETHRPAFALEFAFSVRGPHLVNLHRVQSLNSAFNLYLIGVLVNLERIRAYLAGKVRPLLRNQWPNYNIMIFHNASS